MILLTFIHTPEFYIIMLIVTLAIVVLIGHQRSSGPVREELMASTLIEGERIAEQSIEVRCDDQGRMVLMRKGLQGISMSGAVSAKVTIKGYSITFEERLVDGHPWDADATSAMFILDTLAPERYYIRYESAQTSRSCSLSLRNIAGNSASKDLVK